MDNDDPEHMKVGWKEGIFGRLAGCIMIYVGSVGMCNRDQSLAALGISSALRSMLS